MKKGRHQSVEYEITLFLIHILGIYLCTYLEKLPLIDGKSEPVKKPNLEENAFVYLGLGSGGLPSVAFYLSKTMPIEFGSRAKIEDLYYRLSMGTSGPKVNLVVHFVITMEKDRKFDFGLRLVGNAIDGQLSLVMDGIIKISFGLSEGTALEATGAGQKLGIQFGIVWAQLAITGISSTLSLSSCLSISRLRRRKNTA